MTSKMTPDFILIAAGGSTVPQLNIALFGDQEQVDTEAEAMAAQLSLGGYFHFALAENGDAAHKIVQVYKVDQPKPVVTRRK